MEKIKKFLGISILGIGAPCFLFWGFFCLSMLLALGAEADASWGDFIPVVFSFCKNAPILAGISIIFALVFMSKMDKII